MTTFERFRRDIRSRSNSQLKSSIRRGSENKDPKISNLLNFSASQIKFTYDPKSSFSTFILQITNLTGYKIHFKIRSNNAKNYMVTPFEEVISDRQKIDVKFELVLTGLDISTTFRDKFEILWGKVPYQPTQPTALTQSKIFPVYIEQYNTNGNDFLREVQTSNYQSVSSPNKFSMENKVAAQYPNPSRTLINDTYSNIPQGSLLTKTNLILVSIISFILGFIFT